MFQDKELNPALQGTHAVQPLRLLGESGLLLLIQKALTKRNTADSQCPTGAGASCELLTGTMVSTMEVHWELLRVS